MFPVSELHNSSRQYHYLFKFRGLIRRYIVPYYLQKKIVLLPTKRKIRPFVGRQKDANIHWSVPTSLYDLAINLYTLVVHFIKFRRLVESALYSVVPATNQHIHILLRSLKNHSRDVELILLST